MTCGFERSLSHINRAQLFSGQMTRSVLPPASGRLATSGSPRRPGRWARDIWNNDRMALGLMLSHHARGLLQRRPAREACERPRRPPSSPLAPPPRARDIPDAIEGSADGVDRDRSPRPMALGRYRQPRLGPSEDRLDRGTWRIRLLSEPSLPRTVNRFLTAFCTVEAHRNAPGCTQAAPRRSVIRPVYGFKGVERVPDAVQQGWQGAWPERVLCDVGHEDACDQVDALASLWIGAGTRVPTRVVAGPEDGRALRRQGPTWARRLHRAIPALLQRATADDDR